MRMAILEAAAKLAPRDGPDPGSSKVPSRTAQLSFWQHVIEHNCLESGKLGFQFNQDRFKSDEDLETHSVPKQEPVRYIPWILRMAEAFDLEPWPQIEQLLPVKFCPYFVGMTDEGAKTIGRFHVSVDEFVFACSPEFFSNLK
jgi:hypothetical protein